MKSSFFWTKIEKNGDENTLLNIFQSFWVKKSRNCLHGVHHPLTNQLGQDIYDAKVWQTCQAIKFQVVVYVGQNHSHHGPKIQITGILLDSTLTFVANVEETCKKVRAALFSLKSKFFLSNGTRLQFFKTFVLPHFDYCIALSIYYTAELRMTLVKLYNCFLRKLGLLRLDKFDHVSDIDSMVFNSMLQKHGLFSFSCRIFYRLSLFVHNVFNQNNVSVLRDCFYKTTHHYSLRHTQRLHVVVSKRACDDLNFFIFGPKFINFLYIDTIYYSLTDFKTFLLSNFSWAFLFFTF